MKRYTVSIEVQESDDPAEVIARKCYELGSLLTNGKDTKVFCNSLLTAKSYNGMTINGISITRHA